MASHLGVLEMRLAHSVKTSLGLLLTAPNLTFTWLGAVTAYQVRASMRVRHMMDGGSGGGVRRKGGKMNVPLT
jgi:hypothetical protein